MGADCYRLKRLVLALTRDIQELHKNDTKYEKKLEKYLISIKNSVDKILVPYAYMYTKFIFVIFLSAN